MEDGTSDRLLSSVSIVEIGIKSGLGKLQITEAELRMAIVDLQLKVIPFSPIHAFELFRLPQRTDMFDRMLVATALSLKIPIVGGDREFQSYQGLSTVWN